VTRAPLLFSLPKGVNAEHVQARFSKGLLGISLPKKPDAIKSEKIIPIQKG
jgi:HSP20 family protein